MHERHKGMDHHQKTYDQLSCCGRDGIFRSHDNQRNGEGLNQRLQQPGRSRMNKGITSLS